MARRNRSLEQLTTKLKRLPEAARAELRKALAQSAFEIADTAHANAPRDDGDLRRSIGTRRGAHELSELVVAGGSLTTRPVRAGQTTTYDYALGVEFGNEHSPAQPFFYPAYRAHQRRVKNRLNRAAKKAAEIAVKGAS